MHNSMGDNRLSTYCTLADSFSANNLRSNLRLSRLRANRRCLEAKPGDKVKREAGARIYAIPALPPQR